MSEKSAQEEAFDNFWLDVHGTAAEKFEAGREKYGDAWESTDPEYLHRRMEEKLYEYRQEVEHHRDDEEAIEELAHLVNFAVMYLVRFRDEEWYE